MCVLHAVGKAQLLPTTPQIRRHLGEVGEALQDCGCACTADDHQVMPEGSPVMQTIQGVHRYHTLVCCLVGCCVIKSGRNKSKQCAVGRLACAAAYLHASGGWGQQQHRCLCTCILWIVHGTAGCFINTTEMSSTTYLAMIRTCAITADLCTHYTPLILIRIMHQCPINVTKQDQALLRHCATD